MVFAPLAHSSLTPKTQIPNKTGKKRRKTQQTQGHFGNHHPLPPDQVAEFAVTPFSSALVNQKFCPNENAEESGNNSILKPYLLYNV